MMTRQFLHCILRTFFVLFSLFHLSSTSAAPLLTLELPQSSYTILSGDSIQVNGVITNRTAATLASDEMILNFSDFDIAAVNPTQLLGSEYFTLAPFTFSENTALFLVDISPLVAAGVYTMSITLQDFAGNFSDPVFLTLNVRSTDTPVPETPTVPLIALGILIMSRFRRLGYRL